MILLALILLSLCPSSSSFKAQGARLREAPVILQSSPSMVHSVKSLPCASSNSTGCCLDHPLMACNAAVCCPLAVCCRTYLQCCGYSCCEGDHYCCSTNQTAGPRCCPLGTSCMADGSCKSEVFSSFWVVGIAISFILGIGFLYFCCGACCSRRSAADTTPLLNNASNYGTLSGSRTGLPEAILDDIPLIPFSDYKPLIASARPPPLPDDQEDPPPSCRICFEEYEPDSMVRVLPCDHLFHDVCIRSWFQLRSTCPLCVQHIPDLFHATSVSINS